MLYELRKRQMEKLQREELLVGIIASTTANFSFSKPKTPLGPELFMLHPYPAEPAPQVSGEDIMAAFMHIPKTSEVTS